MFDEILSLIGKEVARKLDRQIITSLYKYKPKRTRHRAIAKAKRRVLK